MATETAARTPSLKDVDFGGSDVAIVNDTESDEEEDIALAIEKEDKTIAAHHGHYSGLPST